MIIVLINLHVICCVKNRKLLWARFRLFLAWTTVGTSNESNTYLFEVFVSICTEQLYSLISFGIQRENQLGQKTKTGLNLFLLHLINLSLYKVSI